MSKDFDWKKAFEKVVQETIHPDLRTPEIEIDAAINLVDISPKLIRILKQFEPFGPGNMTPVFYSSHLKDSGYAKTIGANDEHIRGFVKQKGSESFGVVGFKLGTKLDVLKNKQGFEAVYSIEENEWNGKVNLQLQLKDIR